jgi:hypothetical protein
MCYSPFANLVKRMSVAGRSVRTLISLSTAKTLACKRRRLEEGWGVREGQNQSMRKLKEMRDGWLGGSRKRSAPGRKAFPYSKTFRPRSERDIVVWLIDLCDEGPRRADYTAHCRGLRYLIVIDSCNELANAFVGVMTRIT